MGVSTEFRSIYRHGFARVAACTTRCTLADPAANAAAILEVARACHRRGVALAVFPELGLSGYAIGDLLHQAALLDAVEAAVADLVAASADLLPLLLVGAPLRHAGALYNCAVAIHRGRLLGVVPKVHLPNYREFYEPRHFVAGDGMVGGEIAIGGADARRSAPTCCSRPRTCRASSCTPRSARTSGCRCRRVPQAALAGATVLANLSASNITIGKAETRRLLCASQSARCVAAYLYAAAGRRRVHHRPRLGRPGLDLRERRDAGRDRALPVGQPVRAWPTSTSTGCATSACGWAASTPTAAAIPRAFRRIALPARSAGRRYRPGAQGRALPVRAGRSGAARAGLLRGLQHPGLGPGAAAAGDRHQARGDRRLRRPRFHPRADRLRPGARPARAAAQQHPGLHDARLRHLGAHQGQRHPR